MPDLILPLLARVEFKFTIHEYEDFFQRRLLGIIATCYNRKRILRHTNEREMYA